MKFKKKLSSFWPFFVIVLITIVFFWKFFLKGLLPIPSDIIVGLYFPYLDYKWGTTTGVPVKNPLLSDIPSILYPWRSLVVDQFRQLKLPLWNPYYFLGMPLLAIFQSAAFSPATLLFLFFKKSLAWSLGIVGQPLFAMIFAYLFLRNKKLSKFSSIFGAFIFAFSGFSQAWLEFNVHGWTGAFLPLHLFLVDKVFEGKQKIFGYLLSVSLAFQIFSGYQPIVIYSMLVLFFYVLIIYFWKKFPPELKALKILAFSIVLGFFLSAAQLIPGYELTKLSIRKVDPVAKLSAGGFFPWENFITFLAPDFFGNPAAYNFWGKPFYDNFYGFVGIPALLLALSIFSLDFKKKKESFTWSLLLALSLVMMTGNPLSLFLEKVNFLGLKGGIWAKALFITDFSLAVLAAFGLEQMVKTQFKTAQRRVFLVSCFFSLCLGVCWLLAFGKLSASFMSVSYLNVAKRNLVLPSAVLGGSLFSLGVSMFFKDKRVSLLTGIIFFILSFFSLFYQFNKAVPFAKKEFIFPETPVLKFLKDQKGIFRIEPRDVLPQNFWMPYGLESVSGYDTLLPLNTGQFLTAVETGKVQDSVSRIHLLTNFDSPLFKLLNVRFFLAKKQDEGGRFTPEGKYPDYLLKNPRYNLVFEDKTVGVFEDKQYLPRAWLVKDFIIEKDPEKIIKTLQLAEFNPSETVVLEEPPNLKLGNGKSGKKSVDFGMTEPTRRSYVVKSEKEGILFESAAFFPGWRAYIDGKETKILRANFAFKAIAIPPGTHEVRFYYEPKSVLIGTVLSFLGFIYLSFKLIEWRFLKK